MMGELDVSFLVYTYLGMGIGGLWGALLHTDASCDELTCSP